MGKFKLVLVFGTMVSWVVAGNIQAEDISVPHSFSSGTTIRSSEMNENFDVLYQRINTMQQQIDRLRSYHIPTEGLIAYYPFNGNANDESGNENDGTENGATLTADRFGYAEKAYSFDGSNDYIIVDGLGVSVLDFTVSAWIRLDTHNPGGRNYILDLRGISTSSLMDGNDSCGLAIDHAGNDDAYLLHFCGWFSGENREHSAFQDNIGNINGLWQNTMLVRQGSQLKQYLNGVLISDNPSLGVLPKNDLMNFNHEWVIGMTGILGVPNSETNYWFMGAIDDVRIYNRALSVSEIQFLYDLEKL